MSVLIHEQGGRRTIYYPDDRHLRQYADTGPTLISHRDLARPCKRRERVPQRVGHLGKRSTPT